MRALDRLTVMSLMMTVPMMMDTVKGKTFAWLDTL